MILLSAVSRNSKSKNSKFRTNSKFQIPNPKLGTWNLEPGTRAKRALLHPSSLKSYNRVSERAYIEEEQGFKVVWGAIFPAPGVPGALCERPDGYL